MFLCILREITYVFNHLDFHGRTSPVNHEDMYSFLFLIFLYTYGSQIFLTRVEILFKLRFGN